MRVRAEIIIDIEVDDSPDSVRPLDTVAEIVRASAVSCQDLCAGDLRSVLLRIPSSAKPEFKAKGLGIHTIRNLLPPQEAVRELFPTTEQVISEALKGKAA